MYAPGKITSCTMNERLNVEGDDQTLYLTNMDMASFRQNRDRKVSQEEGAAESLWAIFISPLQGSNL